MNLNEQARHRRLKTISPDKISPNPENPRLIFRQDEMENLLTSIDRHGIQVPITVYEEQDGTFRLIDGERRWRCATKLNLKGIPSLVQDKPNELQNLLLMYNIHALREQWDYFTIASKLDRIIELFVQENQRRPTERELGASTGLTQGQIRRCQLLLNLPERFKSMLLKELELPKSQQRFTEDFFIEMERSLKTILKRFPDYEGKVEEIRDTLVQKFKDGQINSVTDFRQLGKIATAIDNIDMAESKAKWALDRIFDKENPQGIRPVYQETVEFGYEEKRANKQIEDLIEFFDEVINENKIAALDDELLEHLRNLKTRLSMLLGE